MEYSPHIQYLAVHYLYCYGIFHSDLLRSYEAFVFPTFSENKYFIEAGWAHLFTYSSIEQK